MDTRSLLDELESWFRGHAPVVVCLSGGVDSAVLAATAHRAVGSKALSVTGVSPSLAEEERTAASELAQRLGMRHAEVTTHEMEREDYAANPVQRCYFCKSELFDRVLRQLPGPFATATVVEGTHLDDLRGHRPGMRAAGEFEVISPYVMLGWGKDQIRSVADELSLPKVVVEKPSMPCLASRIPFGQRVTPQRLSQVEQAEAVLRSRGFANCRVRHHESIARIELPVADIVRFLQGEATEVATAFRRIGFVYTTVDVLGLRSGSLHEALESSS